MAADVGGWTGRQLRKGRMVSTTWGETGRAQEKLFQAPKIGADRLDGVPPRPRPKAGLSDSAVRACSDVESGVESWRGP